jgi:hypothetical protein
MKRKLTTVLFAAAFLSGCASNFATYNSNGEVTDGIPVAAPVLVKVTTKDIYTPIATAGGNASYCTEELKTEYKFLPLGEKTYIAFSPASLAKGEFKVELSDSGALKSISINSDASSGVAEVNTLLGTVLPYLAKPKEEAKSAGIPAQNIKDQYCLKTGTQAISVEPVSFNNN